MSTATDIQALLRFLSKDAKVPLATALGKVKGLQQAGLGRYDAINTPKRVLSIVRSRKPMSSTTSIAIYLMQTFLHSVFRLVGS